MLYVSNLICSNYTFYEYQWNSTKFHLTYIALNLVSRKSKDIFDVSMYYLFWISQHSNHKYFWYLKGGGPRCFIHLVHLSLLARTGHPPFNRYAWLHLCSRWSDFSLYRICLLNYTCMFRYTLILWYRDTLCHINLTTTFVFG